MVSISQTWKEEGRNKEKWLNEVRVTAVHFLTLVISTSGYATWFTAGGAIHEPPNP